MPTSVSIDQWAEQFARIQKSTTRRNGSAIEIPVYLGFARIEPCEPPQGWYRIEYVYPPTVERNNRDGLNYAKFDPGFNRPLEIWQRLAGHLWGYRRALEKAQAKGVQI